MKLIGIDYGRRRIGCAITDDTGVHIRGLTTIDRKKHPQTLLPLMTIIAREQPDGIVVGLPLDCDEGETRMSAEARAFAENLRKKVSLPIYHIDESMSSRVAASLLRFRKKKDRRRKEAVDRIAACIILENFLRENPPRTLDSLPVEKGV
jgi:putative Holliday junction resolvase